MTKRNPNAKPRIIDMAGHFLVKSVVSRLHDGGPNNVRSASLIIFYSNDASDGCREPTRFQPHGPKVIYFRLKVSNATNQVQRGAWARVVGISRLNSSGEVEPLRLADPYPLVWSIPRQPHSFAADIQVGQGNVSLDVAFVTEHKTIFIAGPIGHQTAHEGMQWGGVYQLDIDIGSEALRPHRTKLVISCLGEWDSVKAEVPIHPVAPTTARLVYAALVVAAILIASLAYITSRQQTPRLSHTAIPQPSQPRPQALAAPPPAEAAEAEPAAEAQHKKPSNLRAKKAAAALPKPSSEQPNPTPSQNDLQGHAQSAPPQQPTRHLGVRPQAMQHRVDREWPLERIFTQPFRRSPSRV